MKKIYSVVALALLTSIGSIDASAQQQLTKEQILSMSIEELSELPLEDLMQAVETLGVSSVDELFAMIMNKNVSSASKKEESSFTSPLSSTVITREEMRTYGISNIEEAFRLIPGMIVTEKTNGIYDIQMRGLNNIPDNNMYLYTENANTLIMIDGRPVQSYIMGSVNFDMLPISIEDVERIEVVRGACGALYGANAVSGVINILTEKPNENSKTISGNLQMGSQNTYSGDIALRKAFSKKFAAGLTFNMQYRQRPTDKLYVIPGQAGMYYCTNQSTMPTPGSQVKTPYAYGTLGQDGVLSLNGVGSIQLDKNSNPVMESLKLEEGKTALDFMTALTNFKTAYAQHTSIFSGLQEASAGGYYTLSEIDNFKQIYPEEYDANGNIVSYRLFDSKEPETLGKDMFKHPELARKQVAFNGYLTFTPTTDVLINLMGGYQNSYATVTPVGDDIFSFNTRTSKTGYVALDASVKGVHALVNYHFGPQDYANGVPGFKIWADEINASLDYDINVGGLGIRPGLSYQYLTYEDYTPEWTDKDKYTWHFENPGYRYPERKYDNLSGFLMYKGILKTFAPSLRLDYKVGGVRLIGAYRADKTNIPDKWHHSWQFAANYEINDRNFVRVVYGRANRGTNLVNSTADFDWIRTNMVYPKKLHFEKNTDADFVKIDNIELGYRVKPVNNVLIDAELFYSKSTGYGALMANSGAMHVRGDNAQRIVQRMEEGLGLYESRFGGKEGLAAAVQANPNMIAEALQKMISGVGDSYQGEGFDLGMILEPYAGIKYSSLPYDVKQMGISFNIDYIISSKLIAKMNANFQKTTIDNYYVYNQTNDIQSMLQQAKVGAVSDLSVAFTEIVKKYLFGNSASIADASISVLKEQYNDYRDCYEYGKTQITHDDSTTPKTNGYEHKATPAFYGMLGLIYKPLQQLEVSAFANFIGKRTYNTKYGSEELGNRCTMNMKIGYKPVQQLEVFANAHNLFNTEKREFVYCDKIGGIYTVGVNFGF
ncbi:MAG: TonB-dependent receptor [Bacteroidales bacterium]|nr:TonB-dependent receptor [Bacteroidales bacterium]